MESAEIELGSDETRPALSYRMLTGSLKEGDEVLVNTEALDLELGSGGFDIVVANLTRGMENEGNEDAEVMKLNYTPLQHAVKPLEERSGLDGFELPIGVRVGVLALHSQLAATAQSLDAAAPDLKVAYIQTGGGALPGALSDTVDELLERSLISEHVTVSPSFGGGYEAVTLVGAIQACEAVLDCDVALVGPGPGIQGSASLLGHGGMQALESAHAALALGARPLIVPRASCADSRPRHRDLSHHTATVLKLLLQPVDIALAEEDSGSDLRGQIDDVNESDRHAVITVSTADAASGYERSGLPANTMGRSLKDDGLFFRQALAGGLVLAGKGATV